MGKSNNINQRIQQHTDGTGAYCIAGEPFTRVEPVTNGSINDLESWERNEVLTLMFKFGINNVCGWMYTLKNMPMEQKLSAFDQICEKFDLCRKCGHSTHFILDCQSPSTDVWTGGMDLRPTYGANQDLHAALEDSERRIAEAKRMVAEAARVLGAM